MRSRIAMVMLYMSWPVSLIHRLWNNDPVRLVSWIKYDKTVCQDFRWYLVYNELWLSATLVISALIIAKRKTTEMQILLVALLAVSLVDIVNYWYWFRRNEQALLAEGLIMMCATILIIHHDTKRANHAQTH